MEVLSFRYFGRFGHFLKAESNVNWLSYPIPPRTAILGLLGAILGLEKDQPQVILEDSHIAIQGALPRTHWHKANIRQTWSSPMKLTIRAKDKGTSSSESKGAKQIPQEWLIQPDYTVYVSLPEPWHQQLKDRLQRSRWHFCPCMGMSEMLAQVEWRDMGDASLLPAGEYYVDTVVPLTQCELLGQKILENNLALRMLRMPQKVSSDRIFLLQSYAMERQGRPIPVQTAHAWKVNGKHLMFL